MAITELEFEREKLRRDLQEIVNELDLAQAAEDESERETHDMGAILRMAAALMTKRPRYMELIIESAAGRAQEGSDDHRRGSGAGEDSG